MSTEVTEVVKHNIIQNVWQQFGKLFCCGKCPRCSGITNPNGGDLGQIIENRAAQEREAQLVDVESNFRSYESSVEFPTEHIQEGRKLSDGNRKKQPHPDIAQENAVTNIHGVNEYGKASRQIQTQHAQVHRSYETSAKRSTSYSQESKKLLDQNINRQELPGVVQNNATVSIDAVDACGKVLNQIQTNNAQVYGSYEFSIKRPTLHSRASRKLLNQNRYKQELPGVDLENSTTNIDAEAANLSLHTQEDRTQLKDDKNKQELPGFSLENVTTNNHAIDASFLESCKLSQIQTQHVQVHGNYKASLKRPTLHAQAGRKLLDENTNKQDRTNKFPDVVLPTQQQTCLIKTDIEAVSTTKKCKRTTQLRKVKRHVSKKYKQAKKKPRAWHYFGIPNKPLEFIENGINLTILGKNLRKEAKCYMKERESFLKLAKKNKEASNKHLANYYFKEAEKQLQVYKSTNLRAAIAFLEQNNRRHPEKNTIDLHYLSVKEAIQVLDIFLDDEINYLRAGRLQKALLKVMTGRGKHSDEGIPKIKPAVKNRLIKRNLKYSHVNPGLLQVSILNSSPLMHELKKQVSV